MTFQRNLVSQFPAFHGNETLYSLVCRFHLLSGHVHATETSVQLFADRSAGFRVDFPSHLASFSEATGGSLGNPLEIFREHSLWGFYRPFVDRDMRTLVEMDMQSASPQGTHRLLGLMPSRVGAAHPLKVCRQCMRTDVKDFGIAVWHVDHQWPSVWYCKVHGATLQYALGAVKRHFSRKWMLPEDIPREVWQPIRASCNAMQKLNALYDMSEALCHSPSLELRNDALRVAYFIGARQHGWMSTDGSIRFAVLRNAFFVYYHDLATLPGCEIVLGAAQAHGGMLGLLMRDYAGSRHPLKHLLLIAFLFESPERFFAAYADALQRITSCRDDRSRIKAGLYGRWKEALRYLVEVHHLSVSSAARYLCIPLPQAMRQAHYDCLTFDTRPHVLDEHRGREIAILAHEGKAYQEMAENLHLKASTIRRFMADHEDIREIWRRARRRV